MLRNKDFKLIHNNNANKITRGCKIWQTKQPNINTYYQRLCQKVNMLKRWKRLDSRLDNRFHNRRQHTKAKQLQQQQHAILLCILCIFPAFSRTFGRFAGFRYVIRFHFIILYFNISFACASNSLLSNNYWNWDIIKVSLLTALQLFCLWHRFYSATIFNEFYSSQKMVCAALWTLFCFAIENST